MKVGVFPGKFCPPHRGHLTAILRAHALCDKLYVVVCDRKEYDALTIDGKTIPASLRKKWFKQELQSLDNIEVVIADENIIPGDPDGWPYWPQLLERTVPEAFHVVFGNEESYRSLHEKYFDPATAYEVIDSDRNLWPISGTAIRNNVFQHWDYLLGPSRSTFAKRVLITGTESCGKSILTKKLAKSFYTSWSEELGRYYSERYLGGDDNAFTTEDFERIAYLQSEQDLDAVNKANRICFFDTDAVVTEFYRKIFLPDSSDWSLVYEFMKPSFYDLVLFMTPEVKWVDDGTRFLGEQKTRISLADKLMNMYIEAGFDTSNIRVIDGSNYSERFTKALNYSMELIRGD